MSIRTRSFMPHVVHPGLHQDYDLDFRMRRVDDIAPTLTSPMLSGLVSNVCFIGRPEVPRGPTSLKTEEGLSGPSGAPPGPDAPGPSCIGRSAPQVQGAKENKQYKQGGDNLDQTLPEPHPVEVVAVIISDDDSDFPFKMPQAVSTPKVEPAWGQKRPLENRSPHSSPPKKWATEKRRRVHLLVKPFYPEGCRRKTSSPRDMKSLPQITTGSRA